MKKYIKFLSLLTIPLLTIGAFLGVKNTKSVNEVKATSVTETVYWGADGTNLYLASYRTNEIDKSDDNGSIGSKGFKDQAYSSIRNSVKEVIFQDRISLTSYEMMFLNFQNIEKMTNISNLDTSNATSLNSMFRGCHLTETLDLSSLDTSKVTDMSNMFYEFDCPKVDVSNWDTSNVTTFFDMFWGFKGDVDVSSFVIKENSDLNGMFSDTKNINKIRFKEINFKNCDTTLMFDSTEVEYLDLSNAITDGSSLYDALDHLTATTLHLPDETNIDNGLKGLNYVYYLIFHSDSVPYLNNESKSKLDEFIPHIVVPGNSYELYLTDSYFKKFPSNKLIGGYFVTIKVNGHGSILAYNCDRGYMDKYVVDNRLAGGIAFYPDEKYVLAENGVSIIDCNNNPIEFNYEENYYYPPANDYSITVTFVISGPAYDFAKSFLLLTGEVCASGNSNNLSSLQAIWEGIITSYNKLSSSDKSILITDTEDTRISAMLDRYSYILSKYNIETTKNLTEFIDGFTLTYSVRDSFSKVENFDATLVLLISVISTSSLLIILLLTKKRKRN